MCKRKGDEATLLLCDGCDKGFHMACLRLEEKDVPDGDWFCPACKVCLFIYSTITYSNVKVVVLFEQITPNISHSLVLFS